MNSTWHPQLEEWFPEIPYEARTKLSAYAKLMREWNEKINLVSRKDIDAFELNHLAPCLAITHKLKIMQGARILDVGTGGGLPGLVMAICYPHAHFLLVDSIAKKIRVVEDIAQRLELKNVDTRQCRAESLKREFDFVTGRAVTALPEFVGWIRKLVRKGTKHSLQNGLLYWKGGPIDQEVKHMRIHPKQLWQLEDILTGGSYPEKYIVHFLAQDLARAKK